MKQTIWTIMLAVTLPTLAALGGYEVGRVVGFNEGMTAEQENSRKAIEESAKIVIKSAEEAARKACGK